MLGIYINGETLDTTPGTQLEMEQENPFLQFAGEIKGDFTLPFDVRTSPKNLRLLGFAGLLQTRVDNRGIECQVFDNNLQHSIGKIKIEKSDIHRNAVQRGKMSCYYLSGVASFFQDIKDVFLTQVDMGGVRSFSGGTPGNRQSGYNNPSGFWAHIHQVVNAPVGAYDYAFFPVINKGWQGEHTKTEVMNSVEWSGGTVRFKTMTTDNRDANVIVPFPYLHYVLKRAVSHVGWRMEGDVFSDPDFLAITMLNFNSIYWAPMDIKAMILGGPVEMLPTVSFNLRDHMPAISIAEFLVALKNRFGWWFDFDRKNKVIRVRQLKNVVATTTKDLSLFASPLIPKTVEQQGNVYALKNEFFGEYGNGQPDLKQTVYKGEVTTKGALPAATINNAGHCYLVRAENNFYINRQDEGSGNWQWFLFAYNVYNVEPDGANQEITTKATTVGCEYYSTYLDFVPRIDNPGIWVGRGTENVEWGIHLATYHGKRNNKSGQPVPFASSGIYDSTGARVAQWALAFECKTVDGVDVGLYVRNWKTVLETLSHPEKFEFSLHLPLPDFMQLQFSDAHVIDGVKMFLSKINSTVPYNGTIRVEALRIK